MAIEDAGDVAGFFDANEFGTVATWADGSGRTAEIDGILVRDNLTVSLGPIGGEARETIFRAAAIGVVGIAQGHTLTLPIDGVVTPATVTNVRPRGDGTVDLVVRL